MSYAEPRRRRDRRIALLLACAAPIALAMPGAAAAQSESAEQAFAIPAGSLSAALQSFSAASGIQLVYASSLVEGLDSPGVNGRMTAAEALARLLAGTGLSGSLSGNTATIRSAGATADGELVTGVVSVEGYQGSPYFGGAGVAAGVNGINGSRDITATEGTKSFTSGALTIGSKVPQAMKDVPQSVSVLTSERMQQQNVTDLTRAMRQLPGVTLVQGGTSLQSQFYSRGFEINSIQIDGGAPLSVSFSNGNAYFPQIDMSLYDHAELLRGASGLFNGYGDPSGSINLVRKKPLDHAQFSLEAQAGSWDNYRVVADATAPLALDGKLRGRLIMTWQDNHHFYNVAKDNKTLISGIADLDVTPTTLLSAGISYTRQDSVPWQIGLPRYFTGEDLGLPRSTSIVFPWNRWDFETREFFGSLEQKIGDDWNLKINLTQNRQTSTKKVGSQYYFAGGVDPADNSGLRLYGQYFKSAGVQFSAEATLSGAFNVLGQRQEIVVGASRVRSNSDGVTSYDDLINSYYPPYYQPYPGSPVYCYIAEICPAGLSPPINLFDFDPYDPLYSEPQNPMKSSRNLKSGQTQWVAFASLRLTAFDKLHLMAGFRWTRTEVASETEYYCTRIPDSDPGYSPNCLGRQIGDAYSWYSSAYSDDSFSWPPSVSLSYDLTRSLVAYAGYTDIYQSQANNLDINRKPIGPITGSNWEAGLKWAPNDGRLNLSLAAYRVRKKGFARVDPPDYSEYEDLGNGISCCYVVDPNNIQQSKGFDLEATGELRAGLQIAASLTYSKTENVGSSFGDSEGRPFLSIQPKKLYKVWLNYDFGAAGHGGTLSGLSLSAGANGQSHAYYSGSVCTTNFVELFPGYNVCATPSEPFEFTVPGHVVLSARADYRFSDQWSLTVNLENILDKTYYQTVGYDPTSGNWYGAPRSVTASLRAKW